MMPKKLSGALGAGILNVKSFTNLRFDTKNVYLITNITPEAIFSSKIFCFLPILYELCDVRR